MNINTFDTHKEQELKEELKALRDYVQEKDFEHSVIVNSVNDLIDHLMEQRAQCYLGSQRGVIESNVLDCVINRLCILVGRKYISRGGDE